MIEYIPSIFEEPVIELRTDVADIFYEYFKLLMKAIRLPNAFVKDEQAHLIFSQLIMGLGNIYKQRDGNERPRYNRNQEIVKQLIRIVIQNYKLERNISFYAEKMHLSPQHLSTTIKKTTGKTLTDIISTFVIRDAQAKLRSTELTIQEIAYSLNFPDISFSENILNDIQVCRLSNTETWNSWIDQLFLYNFYICNIFVPLVIIEQKANKIIQCIYNR